jgi:hypothetical protein
MRSYKIHYEEKNIFFRDLVHVVHDLMKGWKQRWIQKVNYGKSLGGWVFFGYNKSLAGFHHKEVESKINSGWNC